MANQQPGKSAGNSWLITIIIAAVSAIVVTWLLFPALIKQLAAGIVALAAITIRLFIRR